METVKTKAKTTIRLRFRRAPGEPLIDTGPVEINLNQQPVPEE